MCVVGLKLQRCIRCSFVVLLLMVRQQRGATRSSQSVWEGFCVRGCVCVCVCMCMCVCLRVCACV